MEGEGEGQLGRQASRPIGGTRMGHSCGDENLYADVGIKEEVVQSDRNACLILAFVW
jgi:hypothetical protein